MYDMICTPYVCTYIQYMYIQYTHTLEYIHMYGVQVTSYKLQVTSYKLQVTSINIHTRGNSILRFGVMCIT